MDTPDKIEFKAPDGTTYVVRTITWFEKHKIQNKCTTIVNIAAGNIKFDPEQFTLEVFAACISKDGKQMTADELKALPAKIGDVLEQAVNQLNFLSATEIANLQTRQA